MNITVLLEKAADIYGDRVLVGGRTDGLTATALRQAAQWGGRAAKDMGADAILYVTASGPALPVALFAASYAGVPLIPLNFRLDAAQLDGLLAKHPGALVIADPSIEPLLIKRGMRVVSVEDWLAEATAAPECELLPGQNAEPAVIWYTSGTTSEPKGVLMRHHNVVSHILGTVEFGSAETEDAAFLSAPAYRVGTVTNLIANLVAGRRSVLRAELEFTDWLDTVRREAVTSAEVLPTMLLRIVDSPGDRSLPSLRSLTYGGAPMPTSVIRRAMEMWPEVDFVKTYDLTETISSVALLLPEDHRNCLASDDPFVRARLGSLGRPVPGVEIEIRNLNGAVVLPGERGRVWVRGDQVSAEYVGVGRLVDDRGFFDTRDEGFLDEEDYLFISGRSDDSIVRGAVSIAPAEIESVLRAHPAVSDVAVFGVPDEDHDQRIVAVIVLGHGMQATSEELQTFAHRNLHLGRAPDEVTFWSELPRTETGKLVRRHLVEQFRAQRAG